MRTTNPIAGDINIREFIEKMSEMESKGIIKERTGQIPK